MDYRYIILTLEECKKIDFSKVKETSINTVRISVNGLLTFVELDCENIDNFLNGLQIINIVNYDELMSMLQTNEWTNEII